MIGSQNSHFFLIQLEINQNHLLVLDVDWFSGLSESPVIGYCDYNGFGFMTLIIENHSYYLWKYTGQSNYRYLSTSQNHYLFLYIGYQAFEGSILHYLNVGVQIILTG